jgi:hypothetical protein
MGGASSVLSSEDFVTKGQNLKEEYEKLMVEGHTNDEIKSLLMSKYNELFVPPSEISAPAPELSINSTAIEGIEAVPAIEGI